MTQIELDRASEDVRQFFIGLNVDKSGTVITLHGQPMLHVTPAMKEDDRNWTDEKNARRCALINRKYDAGLTEVEQQELDHLQMEMYRHREQVAPLQIAR